MIFRRGHIRRNEAKHSGGEVGIEKKNKNRYSAGWLGCADVLDSILSTRNEEGEGEVRVSHSPPPWCL